MNAVYNFMIDSAKKIKLLSDQMVTETPISGKNLSYLGASLSYEYDKLSHASIQAVQHNLSNKISIHLRKSVLNLGQLCLELIQHIGSIHFNSEHSTLTTKTSVTTQYANNISNEVDGILDVLILLQSVSLSLKQNAYKNARNTIENLLNSFKNIKRYSNPLESEIAKQVSQNSLRDITKELYALYHTLKMVISNIVSSTEESVLASLETMITILTALSEAVKNYVLVSTDEDFWSILSSMEDSFLFIINLFMICEEVDGRTDGTHNKEILKSACKDVVESIRKFAKEATKRMNIPVAPARHDAVKI